MVNNVFAYGPDGRGIFCAINFPSSWHDGSIMANVLPYIIFIRRLGHTRCVLIKAFQETVMLLTFLLDPLVLHKPINLLPIRGHTYYVNLMFTFLYAKQVNGV